MVGLLAEKDPTSVKAEAIPYSTKAYSPFPLNTAKYAGIPSKLITAKTEIKEILATAGQELCSHTYSHFYTLEEGQTSEDYGKDLGRMDQIAASLEQKFTSIVFPRNQINKSYLKLNANKGYSVYRGNQKNALWANSPYAKESLSKKGKRFLDAYYNVSNTQATTLEKMEVVEGMINVPASRFLRPSGGKAILEKRKIKRIKEEMTTAAENGEIYHLWWHPHNFCNRSEEHFNQLKELLIHFDSLRTKFDMQSLNMKEIGAAYKK